MNRTSLGLLDVPPWTWALYSHGCEVLFKATTKTLFQMSNIANEAEYLNCPQGTHKNKLNGLWKERMGHQKQGTIRSPVATGYWGIYCIYAGAVWDTQVCAHADKTCTMRCTTFIHPWCNSGRTAVSATWSASFIEVTRKRNRNICKHILGVDKGNVSSVKGTSFHTHLGSWWNVAI